MTPTGMLDGNRPVDVLAWAVGGTAQTVIVLDGYTIRVHPCRVHLIDQDVTP
jgi:hypothetical protein